jgi:hypothetical protein
MPEFDIGKYEKNTQEQYAALGRFVESFEKMVHHARTGCHDLIVDGYGNLEYPQVRLVGVPLYHQSLAAKPIYEIFRAILIEKITDPQYQKRYNISPDQVGIFSGVLAAISGEYEALANKRNDLLHGTWFVGYASGEDPYAATFHVSRYRTAADGMSKLRLPSTAPELNILSDRCDQTATWISAILSCVPPSKAKLSVEKCFRRDGKIWERIWPSKHKFPSKS